MNILGEVRKVIMVDPVTQNTMSPAQSRQFGTVTNTVITTNGQAFSIPLGGKALIQNWDDEAAFVKFGPNVSTSDCSIILSAGTAANDGKGGSYMIDDYTGTVTVTAAGTVRVNVAIFS